MVGPKLSFFIFIDHLSTHTHTYIYNLRIQQILLKSGEAKI